MPNTMRTYYVTLRTAHGRPLFGTVQENRMQLNGYGRIVESEWRRLEQLRDELSLEMFTILPNHTHAILTLGGPAAGAESGFVRPKADPIKSILRAFKTSAAARINRLRGGKRAPVWLKDHEARLIDNPAELRAVREYIANNVATWKFDEYYVGSPEE